jgi:hypothetical protein
MINGGWKYYYGLENNCKKTFVYGIRNNFSLRLLSLMLSYMDVKFGDVVRLENPGER